MSSAESDDEENKLNLKSKDFDPLLALYNEIKLPIPNAPIYDNLTKFELTDAGEIKIKQPFVKKKEEPGPSREIEKFCEPVQSTERKLKIKKNVLTYMNEVKGPLQVLKDCLERKIRIKVITRHMCGIRGFCEGYVSAFDVKWNLALVDVTEIWTRKIKKKTPILGTPARDKLLPIPIPTVNITKIDSKTEECQRYVKQLFLRGEHVVSIWLKN